MVKRAVIYLRVSTGKQVEGASLETQELMCQNWCTRNDIVIDRIFHDDGVSAKTLNRPAIKELLEYLRKNKGRITYLVTYQTDRLTRDAADFYALKLQLSQHGVEYKNANSSAGKNTASDELIQGLEAVIAQHDNKIKSERVTENMKRHANEGYRMSKAPYGLRNCRDVLGHATVEAVPVIADKIAEVLNAFSTGAHTVASLLELTQKIGLVGPNGRDFSFQTLSKMLRQPLYAGLDKSAHTEGRLVKSRFEGIITPATFYRNQELLRKNKNTAARYEKLNPAFPLRRFVRCESCNRPLRGSAPTSASGHSSPRYHCTGCKSPSVPADQMHEQFVELLASLRPNEKVQRLIKGLIVRVWKDEIQTLNSKEKRLHRLLEALRDKKRLAIEKLISGEITSDEKDEYIKSTDIEVEKISQQLTDIQAVTLLKEEAIDYTLRFMADAPRIWNNADISSRIIYQQQIFPEGLKYNLTNKAFGTPKLSALYTLVSTQKGAEAPSDSTMVIPRGIEPLLPG